ncbi:MAG: hypothetical protein OK449_04555 [Thaumarchaeota archaeon]|nr:hypothetical protein [Nitrososphaerota archaeon]
MSNSDEQLKRAADLKLWIDSRIAELQEEVEKLKEAQNMVDTVLRTSSFRPASEVAASPPRPREEQPRSRDEGGPIPEMRELRRDKGGETIAIAQVTKDKVVIEPVAEVALRSDTPPFKSFLVGKILTGMKAKDEELAGKGKVDKGKELRFNVAEKGGKISAIVIDNYRESERLTEILNTVGWTFSRMLEKGATSSR